MIGSYGGLESEMLTFSIGKTLLKIPRQIRQLREGEGGG
jgi:hypothetical protein